MRKVAVRLPRQLQQALQKVQSQAAAVRKAVSQHSTAGQHVASTCKQQPSTRQAEVHLSDTTLHHGVSTSTTAAPKAGTPISSTACMRKARAADAAISRQALAQQQMQHSSYQKLRQQQQSALQQSPTAQQQRRSFEQRLVAARATAAIKQSPGGYAFGGSDSGVSPSRKAQRQSGTQQKAAHEMFTVWHSSALFAAL